MSKPTIDEKEAHAALARAAEGSNRRRLNKTLHRLRPAEMDDLLQRPGKHNDGGSLYLHVRRPGSGAWVFELRDGASRRSHGLGSCPPVGLKKARELRQAIVDQRKERPRRRLADRLAGFTPLPASAAPHPDHTKSFGAVAKEFLDARENNREFSADQLARYRSMLDLHTKPLLNRPMIEIQSQEIADALQPIWNGSVDSTGRKLRPLIETIFNAARITPNPATLANLTVGLVRGLSKKTTEKTQSVVSLPYAEVPALMGDLAKANSINEFGDVPRILQFVILTGVRIKEALGANWSEINLTERTWTIPAERMKMDVEHIVPLSDAALKVLGPKGDGIIFRGTRFGREIGQNVALRFLKTFGRVDAKGKSITIHGFRSSLATWAEERKPPFLTKVIHFNLAHYSKQDKITKAYLRGEHWDERCQMMQAWGAFVAPI